jgi:hypothetical protein
MKTIFTFVITVSLFTNLGCEEDSINTEQRYTFIKGYCARVTVGGVIGIAEKCFKMGDVVVGYKKTDHVITIRIAEHTSINEGPPNNLNYQEFLDVSVDYLIANI